MLNNEILAFFDRSPTPVKPKPTRTTPMSNGQVCTICAFNADECEEHKKTAP